MRTNCRSSPEALAHLAVHGKMLEGGEYNSSAELAKAEKVNDSYLGRILRLTLIAPDITEAILAGRQPSTLQLDDLLKPLPAVWERQHSVLFNPQ